MRRRGCGPGCRSARARACGRKGNAGGPGGTPSPPHLDGGCQWPLCCVHEQAAVEPQVAQDGAQVHCCADELAGAGCGAAGCAFAVHILLQTRGGAAAVGVCAPCVPGSLVKRGHVKALHICPAQGTCASFSVISRLGVRAGALVTAGLDASNAWPLATVSAGPRRRISTSVTKLERTIVEGGGWRAKPGPRRVILVPQLDSLASTEDNQFYLLQLDESIQVDAHPAQGGRCRAEAVGRNRP